MKIKTIHESLVNGQRRQMVEQIDLYGLCEFWEDYKYYLNNNYDSSIYDLSTILMYFTDAVISYHRIKNR